MSTLEAINRLLETNQDMFDAVLRTTARTIYVDPSSGSDDGSGEDTGTAQYPYRTLAKALMEIEPNRHNNILLKFGETFTLSEGLATRERINFEGHTSVRVAIYTRGDEDLSLEANRANITLDGLVHPVNTDETEIAVTLRNSGPFAITFEDVNITAAGPLASTTVEDGGLIRKQIDRGASPTWIGMLNSSFTSVLNGTSFVNCANSGDVTLRLSGCSIDGTGTLLRETSNVMVTVSTQNTSGDGTCKVCDSGTLYQTVLTNSPTLAL